MIKHYEGIIKKAPYENKKDSIFIDHNPKPIINTIKDEISIYGPLLRLQVLTTPSLKSPMYFFKQEEFELDNSDGYIKLLKPLKNYEGQHCKILLEFKDNE